MTQLTESAEAFVRQLEAAKKAREKILAAVLELNLAVDDARKLGLNVHCGYGERILTVAIYPGREEKLPPAFYAHVSVPL